jgi:hypothetical protein
LTVCRVYRMSGCKKSSLPSENHEVFLIGGKPTSLSVEWQDAESLRCRGILRLRPKGPGREFHLGAAKIASSLAKRCWRVSLTRDETTLTESRYRPAKRRCWRWIRSGALCPLR